MSLPSPDSIMTRFDYERRKQNVVTIYIDESTRKRFHRNQVQLSEPEKSRRADKSAQPAKKPLIDESRFNGSLRPD